MYTTRHLTVHYDLPGRLAGRQAGRLAGWLEGRQAGWLAVWLCDFIPLTGPMRMLNMALGPTGLQILEGAPPPPKQCIHVGNVA